MKKDKNLYVGIAYSSLDIGEIDGTMSQEWADINGHKCLGAFLLEKIEEKKPFKKAEFKGFNEYRTKLVVPGVDNCFGRPDDLPLASECNEEFLSWFIAPLSSTDNMIDVDQYMNLSMGDIMDSLRVVEAVYQAGAKKDDTSLTQEHIRLMK